MCTWAVMPSFSNRSDCTQTRDANKMNEGEKRETKVEMEIRQIQESEQKATGGHGKMNELQHVKIWAASLSMSSNKDVQSIYISSPGFESDIQGKFT